MNCCLENPYKSKKCKECWVKERKDQYHCTWPNCLCPVFTLTLCRNHYRRANVQCAWPNCSKPSFCKQVCVTHYRKKHFPPKIKCTMCSRPSYMNERCFYHFTCRTCTKCSRKVFSKQMCRRHYMRQWRRKKGSALLCTGLQLNV